VAARLSVGTGDLPHDITERLRARACKRWPMAGGNATLGFDGDGLGFWGRIASALPIVALAAGLVAINVVQNEYRAQEVAEVDAALLTDDLPPAAYADPGFVQFLKTSSERSQ
jgi:hypothetical protein